MESVETAVNGIVGLLEALCPGTGAGWLVVDQTGVIVRTSARACELFGVATPATALVGTPAESLFHAARDAFDDGRLSRERVAVPLSGAGPLAVWLVRSTQSSEFDERLAQQRAFFEGVLDALPAQLAVFSSTGVYEYVTPSAIRDPEVRRWIVGKTDTEYGERRNLPREVVEQRRHRILHTVASRETTEFDESITTKEGELRHFRRFTMPVLDEQGQVQHVLGYGLDVTAQKRAEEQLLQVQKMDAVGRLAGGISHDFNNLLTVINGFAQTLHGQMDADDPRRELLDPVLDAGKRAAALTSQLMAFSRRAVVQPITVDVNRVVEETTSMLRRLVGDWVDMRVSLGTGPLSVKMGAGRLEQVLVNLVLNARDAMPVGGRLTISTARRDLRNPTSAREHGLRPGTYAELRVVDTGAGMSAETRARIFEPFFTTKEAGKGTGLGLSTVYAIVTELGGWVFVESSPGAGSTFRVLLPATAAELAEPEVAVRSAQAPTGTETVLVAEDEMAVRRLLQHVLGRLGYRVLAASDGREALDMARSFDGPIQLVLSDVAMPRLSGGKLVKELLKFRPDVRVIYASGYADDDLVRQGLAESAAAFIAKPFNVVSLAHLIRDVLDRPA